MVDKPKATSIYVLRLFVTGASPNSARAIGNIKALCDKYFKTGEYELEIIDVYQQPAVAQEEQIVALPLLVKSLPLPVKRMVGSMSNEERVLKGLDMDLN